MHTDTHAHLSYIAQRSGPVLLDMVIKAYSEAREGGVGVGKGAVSGKGAADGVSPAPILVDPGVEPDDFPRRVGLFGHLDFIRLAAGIWPSADALAAPDEALAQLSVHAGHELCRAVGECGLDYHHMNGGKAEQRRLFEGQLMLADRLGKPVIVHSREAAGDTADMIGGARLRVPVVIHCFGYGPDEAERFLSLGCMVSFAGNITYRSGEALRDACRIVPADRLLLETDAPYMNPHPGRGSPSTSLDIERTYLFVAGLRGEDVGSLDVAVTRNTRAIFGDP